MVGACRIALLLHSLSGVHWQQLQILLLHTRVVFLLISVCIAFRHYVIAFHSRLSYYLQVRQAGQVGVVACQRCLAAAVGHSHAKHRV